MVRKGALRGQLLSGQLLKQLGLRVMGHRRSRSSVAAGRAAASPTRLRLQLQRLAGWQHQLICVQRVRQAVRHPRKDSRHRLSWCKLALHAKP